MALAKSKRPVIKTLQEVGRYAIGIVWNDGHDSIFPLETLRRTCPATSARPTSSGAIPEASQRLRQFSRLGDSGVFIAWVDGHETLFTTDDLRSLCRCAYCVAEPEKPITGG